VYVRLVTSTVIGCPAVTDGLDGDLARLQEWPCREDGPVRVRAAGYGAQPVRPGALGLRTGGRRRGYRTKASGRPVVRRVPAGASRPPATGAPTLPAVAAYAVTRRQARGALGAPLKT
jgi:hypothetical protein